MSTLRQHLVTCCFATLALAALCTALVRPQVNALSPDVATAAPAPVAAPAHTAALLRSGTGCPVPAVKLASGTGCPVPAVKLASGTGCPVPAVRFA